MSTYEIISIVLACIAVIVSSISIIISIQNSRKGLNRADVQNLVSLGTIELNLHEIIRISRQRLEDLTIQITPLLVKKSNSSLNLDEKIALDALEKVFNSSIETNINSYEEACSKYLDSKVDKERFKKIYYSEIRQLVENDAYKPYFDGLTSRYKAIIKVYTEWHNLEQ